MSEVKKPVVIPMQIHVETRIDQFGNKIHRLCPARDVEGEPLCRELSVESIARLVAIRDLARNVVLSDHDMLGAARRALRTNLAARDVDDYKVKITIDGRLDDARTHVVNASVRFVEIMRMVDGFLPEDCTLPINAKAFDSVEMFVMFDGKKIGESRMVVPRDSVFAKFEVPPTLAISNPADFAPAPATTPQEPPATEAPQPPAPEPADTTAAFRGTFPVDPKAPEPTPMPPASVRAEAELGDREQPEPFDPMTGPIEGGTPAQ